MTRRASDRARRRRIARPSWAGPIGSYVPGSTPVHRASPGLKLLTLAVLSVALTVLRDPLVATAALTAAVALVITARIPVRTAVRTLLPITLVAGTLGLYQWWSRDWHTAVQTSATLLALVVLASVVTATTRTDHMLDALVRAARPLRRVGIDPETLALTVSLMLRTIPVLVTLVGEVRDAARARGLGRNPRALLVPFALRAVARAHTTGDALAARGILD